MPNIIYIRLISCLLFLICVKSQAQTTNTCGVIASISPATADSVVPLNTIINFSSTSTNATSVKWLLDDMTGYTAASFNYVVGTGVHTISLIASNGNCTDTTTVVYYCAGTPHGIDSTMFANYGYSVTNDYGTSIDNTSDNGFVLGGYSVRNGWCGADGLVVKLREKGCIEWSKKIIDTISYCPYTEVNTIYASTDGSYYVAGLGYLMKLDNNGKQQWNKKLVIDTYTFSNFSADKITGDQAGNIYLLSKSLDFGWMVTKMAPSGTVVWSRYYQLSRQNPTNVKVFTSPSGILWLNGYVYVTGGVSELTTGNNFSFLTKMKDADGKTEWQYAYRGSQAVDFVNFNGPSAYDTLIMVANSGKGQGVVIIDPQGRVRKTVNAQLNTSYGPHITKAEADAQGGIYIMQWTEQALNLQPYFAYSTNFIKVDTSLNKYWGFVYGDYYRGYFRDIALSKTDFAGIGNDFQKVVSGIYASRDMRVAKINQATSSIDNYCNYVSDFTVSSPSIEQFNFTWGVDSALNMNTLPITYISLSDAYVSSRYSCPDFIDSCSFVRITGPTAMCSFADTYTYSIHRNRKCALVPNWKLPDGVSIVHQTDTTVSFRFPGFGSYKITCDLESCIPVIDSVRIIIAPKTTNLNLGPDTLICPQSSIVLHAGKQFMLYQWQDGSTDSVLTINQPGTYWVQVTDSCGNRLRDSILIQPYNAIVDAGPDRVKCNDDTLHLEAPSGFLSYEWSNNYKLSSTISQHVVANPLIDTSYYLKAEKLPGCYAFDTVKVIVNSSLPLYLGNDRTLCDGDSVLLDPGPGFVKYLWSTNASSQQLIAKKSAIYSIAATSNDGCKSYDTLKVLVFNNPKVQLDHTNSLCAGTSRVLDAGNFASYLWNDGSTLRTLNINATGMYNVDVTDANGCTGKDTATISALLPLPANFLPSDTALCSYSTLALKPLQNFKSYTWSTNQLTASVTISKPGLYWLQVVDISNCIGKDSIVINPKECMFGFYIPTAFTPNRDGKNDLFHPFIFGNLKQYEFIIYNRWGQVIFQTKEFAKAWDGTFSGYMLESNIYVWTCTFQLEGEEIKQEKGTVMLTR